MMLGNGRSLAMMYLFLWKGTQQVSNVLLVQQALHSVHETETERASEKNQASRRRVAVCARGGRGHLPVCVHLLRLHPDNEVRECYMND